MYTVGDAQSHLSLVGDGGEEEDVWHVHSMGCSVRHVSCGE